MRDYKFRETYVVLFEHVDEVTHRMRLMHQLVKTVQFSVGTKDGHIYRKQFTIKEGTNSEDVIMKRLRQELKTIADPYALYRTISVTLTNFIPDSQKQVSLFQAVDQMLKQ